MDERKDYTMQKFQNLRDILQHLQENEGFSIVEDSEEGNQPPSEETTPLKLTSTLDIREYTVN